MRAIRQPTSGAIVRIEMGTILKLAVLVVICGGGAIAIAVVAIVALKWPALARMPPLSELHPSDPAGTN